MNPFPELSLSVVVPAYNEQNRLESMIRRTIDSLSRLGGTFEVVLIDDCSTDGTGALADRLAEEFPQLRVVHNATNLKQGACLDLGFRVARHDLVTHNAVDYPFDFDDLPEALCQFPAADVVVITRRSYPGVTTGRRFVSRVHRALIHLVFGLAIEDYNFVQVYKRAVLLGLPCFSVATAFMTVERIVRAHHAGHRVVAVEAEYHPRPGGASSSGNLRVVCESLRDMARLWIELKLRRPAKAAACEGGGR